MMQLGVSGMMGSPGDGVAAPEQPHENGGASGGSSEVGGSSSLPLGEIEKSGGGGGGGNRWPRQETLALLQIRHDMDAVFRDSSLKGPLWEEVSRKMAELGFQRSAKKCKEKFENVFKYHKRTRDGRASKSDGKTYRFFDQLEALENTPPPPQPRSTAAAPPPPPPNLVPLPPHASAANNISNTVPSTSPSPTPISVIPPPQSSNNPHELLNPASINNPHQGNINFHHHHHMMHTSFLSNSTSSSTSSDEDIQRRGGSGSKKRKWKDYFERLMRDIVHKQEDMQKKFLDALERRDRDRVAREEAWRVQEMARMNRERELLVQERQMAAAKDEAVIAFLQKVADQHNLQVPMNFTATTVATPQQSRSPLVTMQVQSTLPAPPPPQLQQSTFTQPPPILTTTTALITKTSEASKKNNNVGDAGEHYGVPSSSSSSRWPKAEVQALINLRTSLDLKYQDNGPKGPLWEEISSEMSKLGYSRNAKRCKEKWENINKYYKKVKESNKKRPDDSKTCPYFHQLEAIYKARNETSFNQVGYGLKPENPVVPIMARPEQQWPVLPQQQQQQGGTNADVLIHAEIHKHEQEHQHDDIESTENNENVLEDEDDDGEDDDDDDDDDQGGAYEMIPIVSKQTASNTVE